MRPRYTFSTGRSAYRMVKLEGWQKARKKTAGRNHWGAKETNKQTNNKQLDAVQKLKITHLQRPPGSQTFQPLATGAWANKQLNNSQVDWHSPRLGLDLLWQWVHSHGRLQRFNWLFGTLKSTCCIVKFPKLACRPYVKKHMLEPPSVVIE